MTTRRDRGRVQETLNYVRTGWREWVSLPTLGVSWMKAKLDTGARSSAVHVFDPVEVEADGERRVRFGLHPWQGSEADAVEAELPLLDVREVRSSSGHVEERWAVPMDLVLMGTTLRVEMTLARRDQMGFRMLVGREALKQGFLVDSSASYVGGRPPLAVRRANRGR